MAGSKLRIMNQRRSYHGNRGNCIFDGIDFDPTFERNVAKPNTAQLMELNSRVGRKQDIGVHGNPAAIQPKRILCLPAPRPQPTNIIDLSAHARAKRNNIIAFPAPPKPIALLPAPKPKPAPATKYKVGDVLRVPRSSWKREIVRVEVMPTSVYYGFKTGIQSNGNPFAPLMCPEQSVIAAQATGYRA